MSTDIRAKVSTKNRYWIDKHRYYELKHFCLQYSQWKKMYASLDGLPNHAHTATHIDKNISISSSTEVYAEARIYFHDRMRMVEDVSNAAAEFMGGLLLRAVTEELSYEVLNAQTRIPCSRDTWYAIYRKFFWLLDKARK